MKLRLWLPFIGWIEFELRRESDDERKARVEKEFRERWRLG